MEILQLINGMNVPPWVVIVAVLVILWKVADTAGLLNPLKNIVNSINQDRTEARQFERARQRDQEEAVQAQQAQSLNQVIEINETLINTITTVVDSQLSLLREIRASQITVQGKFEIVQREWSRIEEILNDIDIFYHEIREQNAAHTAVIEELSRAVDRLSEREPKPRDQAAN